MLLSCAYQVKQSTCICTCSSCLQEALRTKRPGLPFIYTCRRAGGLLALSAVAIVTPTPPEAWADLCRNYVFRAGFWGWFTAQTAKVQPQPPICQPSIETGWGVA